MLYYMVEFDPRPGVNRTQITQAYRKFVKHFGKTFPGSSLSAFSPGIFFWAHILNTSPSGKSQTTPR